MIVIAVFFTLRAAMRTAKPSRRNIIFYSLKHLFNYEWMSDDKSYIVIFASKFRVIKQMRRRFENNFSRLCKD